MEMNEKVMKQLVLLTERYPQLEAVKDDIWNAYEILEACFVSGGKLLVAGTAARPRTPSIWWAS